MALTADEKRKLRHLLRKCGRADLVPEIAELQPRRAGRKARDDHRWLIGLETFARVCMRDRGMKRMEALRWLAAEIERPRRNQSTGKVEKSAVLAASAEALAARWHRKLREAGFDQREAKDLWPRGLDVAKLTLWPERWLDEPVIETVVEAPRRTRRRRSGNLIRPTH